MTATDKDTLKGYFNTGDIPTEAQFSTLIDSFPRTFCPVDFGAAGDGVTDDSAAFTALKTAVESNGGGIIDGQGLTYVVTTTGIRDFQQYTNINYAVWLDSDNVHIRNMTLKLAVVPIMTVSDAFSMLVIGNGVTQRYNCSVRDIKLDATDLTDEEIATLDDGPSQESTLGLFNLANFIVENVYIPKGWGNNGSLTVGLFSEHGVVRNVRIDDSTRSGLWCDGLQYSWIENNYLANVGIHGIILAPNADNARECLNLYVARNYIQGIVSTGSVGIACNSGLQNSTIESNIIDISGANSIHGIRMTSASTAGRKYISQYNRIINNHLIGSSGTTFAISLRGVDVGTYDGTADEVNFNVVANNSNKGFTYETYLEESAQDNIIINNYGLGAAWNVTTKAGVTTATGNLTTPNYEVT